MWNFQSGMKAAPGGSDIGWSHRAPDLWGCKQAWRCQLPLGMRVWWWMVKETYEISGIWNDKIYIYMHIYIYIYVYIYIYHISYIIYPISYIIYRISNMIYQFIWYTILYDMYWYVTYNCFFTWAFCIHVPPKETTGNITMIYHDSYTQTQWLVCPFPYYEYGRTRKHACPSLLILEMWATAGCERKPFSFGKGQHLLVLSNP